MNPREEFHDFFIAKTIKKEKELHLNVLGRMKWF
jgi:hypothetical protein